MEVVYFDFQKAFDTVPHQRRVRVKLKTQCNDAIIWLENWLTDRIQIVDCNIPNYKYVLSGLLLGSVLEPILF